MMKRYKINDEEYPGVKLKGEERYKKLYHYTSFESFVKIWLTKKLRFSPVTSVNDIQEKFINAAVSNKSQIDIAKSFIAIRKSFKQVSFTMDYDSYLKGCMSPMMWGLYADKAKGVCIELDYKKIQFPQDILKGMVKYKTILEKYHGIGPEVNTTDKLEKYIKKRKEELFFTKQKCWAEENEYRVLSNKHDFLDIKDAISAICLADTDSPEMNYVRELVGDSVPIKVFTYCYAQDNFAIPYITITKDDNVKNKCDLSTELRGALMEAMKSIDGKRKLNTLDDLINELRDSNK